MRYQRSMRQPPHTEVPDEPRVGERSQRDRTTDATEGEWKQCTKAIGIAKHLLCTRDIGNEDAKDETGGDAVAKCYTLGEDEPQSFAESPATRARRQRRLRLRQAQRCPD